MTDARAWLLRLPLVVMGLVSLPSAAQPTLRVRAEARIELGGEPTPLGLRIHGALLDDLGVPLGARELSVSVRDERGAIIARHRLRSDRDGRFHVDVRSPDDTPLRVTAIFGGDASHERLEVERVVDRSRADVRLHLELARGERVLPLDDEGHEVRARVSSDAGGEALELELRDELDRTLARATTDGRGEATFVVPSSELGAPGAGRLVLWTHGDARRAEGRTELPILRRRVATLTLAAAGEARPGEVLVASGALVDAHGPLRRRAIGLFDGDRHLGSVLTDDTGRFEWRGTVAREDAPRLSLVARFESDEPGHGSAASAPVDVVVSVAAPFNPWSLAALLLSVASWLGVRWLWRRARPAPAPTPQRPPIAMAPVSARGAPRDLRLAGRLSDRRDEALAGRVVARDPAGREHHADCAPDGTFALELPPGAWQVRFEAPRHAALETSVTTPHRGEWRAVDVQLESWRERALAVFRRVAGRVPIDGWEKRTLHEMSAQARDPRVRALGRDVERAYYGPLAPSDEDVEALESRERAVQGPPAARTSPHEP